MSKVMLILDKPKKCVDCILLNDRHICIAADCNPIGMEAELCPLEELPEWFPLKEMSKLKTKTLTQEMINKGWDDFVNKIIGDDDEID